jgi:hypothetical protein
MIWIVIQTTFEAKHKWNEAPEAVRFLSCPHRHKFYVKVAIPVGGKDRELEFFTEKKKIDTFIKKRYANKTLPKSCEQIAFGIKKWLDKNLKRITSVAVYEDNENGAIVE